MNALSTSSLRRSLVAATLACSMAVMGCGSDSDDDDIIDVASEAGSFTTLLAAVDAAGLTDTLRGDGPFTVLAPTDDAFAALPPGTVEDLLLPENIDTLTSILTLHVASGAVPAEVVVTLDAIPTLNGASVPVVVDGGTVRVGDATVIQTDIEADNGIIHVIDAVLLP